MFVVRRLVVDGLPSSSSCTPCGVVPRANSHLSCSLCGCSLPSFPCSGPRNRCGPLMATMYGPSRPPSTGSALTAPGADVFSWLLAGSHTNLVIVLLTVVASMAWGLLLIAAMVARNAALASSSVVVVDALISVPTVLIALILAVPLGASIAVIVIACGSDMG